MESDVLLALESEVARFRAWAVANPDRIKDYPVYWETYYPDWGALYVAFSAFVAATSCQDWSEDIVDMLLYAIARDEENWYLVKEVARNPDDLLFLAEQAVNSSDPKLKSQIAWELRRLGTYSARVEPLLLQFVRDDDVWVRRQALSALFVIDSPHWSELAEAAWDLGDEWQRVDILYALKLLNSPQLAIYLAQAEADGRPNITEHAEYIRAGNLR